MGKIVKESILMQTHELFLNKSKQYSCLSLTKQFFFLPKPNHTHLATDFFKIISPVSLKIKTPRSLLDSHGTQNPDSLVKVPCLIPSHTALSLCGLCHFTSLAVVSVRFLVFISFSPNANWESLQPPVTLAVVAMRACPMLGVLQR